MVLLTRALGKEKQKENNLEVGSAEIGVGRSLLHIELTDNYQMFGLWEVKDLQRLWP